MSPLNIEWCALGISPCWTRAEWIGLWSSFGGVLIAFALGSFAQAHARKREKRAATHFLTKTLKESLEAISFFVDNESFQKTKDEYIINRAFGGLGHAASAVRWAIAHPEKFEPTLFLRLMKIEDRVISGGKIGPATFNDTAFGIDASTHLNKTATRVASDIRFLLQLR